MPILNLISTRHETVNIIWSHWWMRGFVYFLNLWTNDLCDKQKVITKQFGIRKKNKILGATVSAKSSCNGFYVRKFRKSNKLNEIGKKELSLFLLQVSIMKRDKVTFDLCNQRHWSTVRAHTLYCCFHCNNTAHCTYSKSKSVHICRRRRQSSVFKYKIEYECRLFNCEIVRPTARYHTNVRIINTKIDTKTNKLCSV